MVFLRISKNDVKLSWFVNTKEDVSDFVIFVKDKETSEPLQEKILSYDARSTVVRRVSSSKVFFNIIFILPTSDVIFKSSL